MNAISSDSPVGGDTFEAQFIDAFDESERRRLIDVLSSTSTVKDFLIWTKFRGQTLKTEAARGEQLK